MLKNILFINKIINPARIKMWKADKYNYFFICFDSKSDPCFLYLTSGSNEKSLFAMFGVVKGEQKELLDRPFSILDWLTHPSL